MRRDGKKYGFRCVFAAECIPPEPQKPKNSNVILPGLHLGKSVDVIAGNYLDVA